MIETKLFKISEIKPNPNNPRIIKDDKFLKLVNSIKEFPEMLKIRPIVINEHNIVLGGNMRLKACKEAKLKEIPVIMASELTEAQQREFIIKDNLGFGEWDFQDLAQNWNAEELETWGLDMPFELEPGTEDEEVLAHEKLQEKFIVPPFSILDTRQGYWNERKKYWKSLIKDFGESRENTLHNSESSEKSVMNEMPSVSILDPVLAEITNKWFGLENCKTFDCFAGDTVFGYVSSYLGNNFTGIELRKEQADLNNERVKGFNAKYVCDDGRNVLNHIEPNSQDLLFSCPPYFNLEVYSNLENDASNQETYTEFIAIIESAFQSAIKCLKENRFAVITVGDIRDKEGFYYNYIDDIKRIFINNGMKVYNELILIESLGTLPQRVQRFMSLRKVGKCHQNVLVFYKGNTKEIKNIFPKIEIDESADV